MILYPVVAGLLGALLGTIVGSFLATILIRWPTGESVLVGRSRCDGCGRTLGPRDLVPLLSFAWNRGRCRTCGASIDAAHLAIELAAAAIAGTAFALTSPIAALGWSMLGWGLLLLAALDWRHFWLPDPLTLGLAGLGIALGGVIDVVSLVDRLVGLAAGYGALWTVARLYRVVRHRDGMGGGDPKLLGAIGAWLGWQALPFVLLAAALLGMLLAMIAVGRGRWRGRSMSMATALPLGTLLCVAALPGWLCVQVLGLG